MSTLKTIEMFGKKGRLVVNEKDRQEWERKGYSTKKPKAGNQTGTIDFSKYTDEKLLDFAAQAGIPGTIKKREILIQKLNEAGFDPDKQGE